MSTNKINKLEPSTPISHWAKRVKNQNFDQSIKEMDNYGNTVFRAYSGGHLHCQFGPALIRVDGTEEWYLFGFPVEDASVKTIKSILEDIKLAPLYINHTVFKYTARWALKNFKDKP